MTTQAGVQFIFLGLFVGVGSALIGAGLRHLLAAWRQAAARNSRISDVLLQIGGGIVLAGPALFGSVVQLPALLAWLQVLLAVVTVVAVFIAWPRLRFAPRWPIIGAIVGALFVLLGGWSLGFGLSERLIGVALGGGAFLLIGGGIVYTVVRALWQNTDT